MNRAPLKHPFSPASLVLVIGAAGVDVVRHPDTGMQPGTSTPAKIRFSFGAVALNISENLARLGQPVKLITAVGKGYFGEQLLKQVSDADVDTSLVIRTEEPTGSYLAILEDGAKQFALDDLRSINALTPAYLRDNYQIFKEASRIFADANLPESSKNAYTK